MNKTIDRLKSITVLIALALSLAASARAQDDMPPLPVDPRPLEKLISDKERAELAAAKKPKKIVETYLDIAEEHLDSALTTARDGDIAGSERHLDIYNKAVAAAFNLTLSLSDGKRGLSKKIEQTLYGHIKQIAAIEEVFPLSRLAFAEAAMKHTKHIRVQALNEAFAAGDVLTAPTKDKPQTDNSPGKDGTPGKTGLAPRLARQQLIAVAFTRAALQIGVDYLTEEEDEQVRSAQKPDDRIKVFMKIADRRLAALRPQPTPVGDKKALEKVGKEEKEWGVLPKLTRAQLLVHYTRTIDEALAKLEDAHERNPKNSAIPKALNLLLAATQRHLEIFHSIEAEVKNDSEDLALKAAIARAEFAQQGANEALKQK